jgi:protein-disulfide isomerase
MYSSGLRVRGSIAVFVLAAVVSFAGFVSGQDAKAGAFPPLQIGNLNAPNKIEIYNDFQCPASAYFFKVLTELEAKYPDQVLITFRNFPLNGHANAWAAARAVEAAAAEGKFVEMSRLIFESQEKWKASDDAGAIFADYAAFLKLDPRSYGVNIESAQMNFRITQDIERGRSLNVNGTPWMLLNDHPMPYGDALEIEKFITHEKSY